MKRFLAALASLAFALVAARALAVCDPGGIGGTGIRDGGGIGGTGVRAEADLDVYGVITGFASICVNGIELHYDAATPVSINGAPADPSVLALGQVVVVRAAGDEKQARARAIQIVEAAAGQVSAVDAAGPVMQLGNQRVRIEASTVFGAGVARERLSGETVRVSGLPAADGSIVATRIDAGPARGGVGAQTPELRAGGFSIQGYVSEVRQQDVRIAGMRFEVPRDVGAQLQRDRLVRVTGRLEGGRRIVERADMLSGALNPRPERSVAPPRPGRDSTDRRGSGGSGREGRDSAERMDRSGPGGGDRSGRGERPERPDRADRSGRH